MSNKVSETETPSLSTLGAKAIGANSPANSHAGGHDAIPRAVGDIPPSGVYIPDTETGRTVAGSNAMRSSLVVGASRSPLAPVRGRAGRFLGPGERVKAVRRGLRKREARLQRSMAHCREPRSRDLERWDGMRAEIVQFQETLAALLAGQSPPMPPVTGSRSRELPDSVALAGSPVTSPGAP